MDNINLEFEDEAIRTVAKKAIELKTGARGLRTILEEHMLNIMYSAPQNKDVKKIVITPSVIQEGKEPIIIKKPKEEKEEKLEAVNE